MPARLRYIDDTEITNVLRSFAAMIGFAARQRGHEKDYTLGAMQSPSDVSRLIFRRLLMFAALIFKLRISGDLATHSRLNSPSTYTRRTLPQPWRRGR